MFELYFLFIYLPRRIGRVAKKKGKSAFLWWLGAAGVWIGVETVIGLVVGVIHVAGVELWGWSADEHKVGFVGFGYLFALICGALAGSFVVSKLEKTPAKVNDHPNQYHDQYHDQYDG
jgi:hypothetical protein